MQLFQLQLTIIARPFIGGIGFLLVVPAIGFTIEPVNITNPQLALLVSLLPETNSLAVVLSLFFIFMLMAAALDYWQSVTAEAIEQKIVAGIRRDIFRVAMHADVTVVGRIHPSDYTRTIIDEAESVTSTFDLLVDLVALGFVVLIYTGICLYLSPALTAVAATMGIVLLLTIVPFNTLIERVGLRHLEATEDLYRKASDQVKGIRHIKSSKTADNHTNNFNSAVESLSREELKYTSVSSLTQLIYSIISVMVFCVLAYLAIDVFNTELALVVILALVFSRLMPQINQLRTIVQRLAYYKPRLEELYDTIEQLKQQSDPPYRPVEFDLDKGIEMTGICYRYNDSEKWALNQFTTTIAQNQLVVVSGTSGIGKSTLADIICGLTLPQAGQLKIGDTLIDPHTQMAWREHVSYVPQTPFLIEGSIRDNLNLLRKEPAGDKALFDALHQAVADFVFELPSGLDTIISDEGSTLSVGERQRLELARAFLDNHPILVLDETTSYLDPLIEARVITALQSRKHNRIIIVISHRQSVAHAADLNIVINDESPGS